MNLWPIPIGSMGLVYLPTFTIQKTKVNVGKYTSPMDPMGMIHFGQPHPVNQVDSHPPGFLFTGFQGNKPS